jgi:hypothetical protein
MRSPHTLVHTHAHTTAPGFRDAICRFRELQAYILQRRDELVPRTNELSQEELLGEAPRPAKSKRGFS